MIPPSIENLRRRAAKLGYRLTKTNWRRDTHENEGGYRIVEVSGNFAVRGVNFDCDLEEIAMFLADEEATEAAAA